MPCSEFNEFLTLDPLGLIVLSIISGVFCLIAVYAIGYYVHEQRSNRTFCACLLFLLASMTLVTLCNHLGLLWVALASTTLFAAPLISFHRCPESLEATWKYLLVCSVGVALALMGTFFLAFAGHEVQTLFLSDIINGKILLSGRWLKLAVIFMSVGYGCKMGLAPMHSWKPAAYGQATGMVAALMSSVVTLCSFLAFCRIGQICAKSGLSDFYSSLLFIMGGLSLVIAPVLILGEGGLKRVLAYSSVENMGILVLGLGFGGLGVFAALFHMVNNALSKAVMFLTAGSIAQKYGSTRVSHVRGVVHAYPVTGVFLLIGLFAGTGMFPFATFHSELMVINAAIISRHYGLAALFVASLSLMFIGMTRIIFEMSQGPATAPVLAKQENFWMNVAIALPVLALVILGLWMPAPLEIMLRKAAGLLTPGVV
ncbi:MAG: hydrogenase [Candidatus Omnitrophica bacterium]|nr:hydrogenase [Candidatus Omnitrophota bacterium]